MTYENEVKTKRNQNIGFYFKFEGIETMLSTHNFNGLIAGDFLEAVNIDTISNISNSLDRQMSFIEPSGCSFQVADSPQIRQYFLRKGGVEKSLTANVTAFDTSISVDDMGLTIGDDLYLNRETLTITSSYSGGAYNVSRAAYGSVVTAHAAGSIVSTRPRHWLTRNCTFYAVDIPTNFTSVFGIYFLSDSPKFTNGAWNLNLVDLLAKLAAPIFKGWKEQESIEISDGGDYIVGTGENNSNPVTLGVEDIRNFVANHDDRGHVKISFGDYWGVFVLFGVGSINTGTSEITVAFSHVVSSNFGEDFSKSDFKNKLIDSQKAELKLVLFFDGQINYLANLLLHSHFGDGLNGYYDKLGGHERVQNTGNFDVSEKKIGAGIPQSLVDSTSFLYCSRDRITIYIDEQQTLIDFFANEILWRSGGYLYVSSEGKIAFKRYAPLTVRNNALTLNETQILQTQTNSVDDETTQVSRAVFECNYHPQNGFLKGIEILFSDDEATLGDSRAELSFKCKGIWVGGIRNGMINVAVSDFLQIQVYLERYQVRQANSGHKISIKLPWQLSELAKIGVKIKVTDSTLPSHTDSGSLSEVFFEVVGDNLNVESGDFVVECESVLTGVLVCPSFEVASYNSGSSEITVNNDGNLGEGTLYTGSSAENVAQDWPIRIYFASTNFETYEDNLVYSSTVDFIVLRNAPTINPSAGDILTIRNGEDTGELNSDNADILDYAFGANAGLQVGSGAYLRSGARWG